MCKNIIFFANYRSGKRETVYLTGGDLAFGAGPDLRLPRGKNVRFLSLSPRRISESYHEEKALNSILLARFARNLGFFV